MRKLITLFLSLFCLTLQADTKISQLDLGSAAATNASDSFPYVDAVLSQTKRLLLSDLLNLPTMQSQFSLMIPSQTGNNGKFLKTNGTITSWATGGTVSSVAIADGSSTQIFNVSGSPVTSTGTLTLTLKTKTANTIFSGPTTGAAAQPTFRALVGADLPNPSSSTLGGVQSYAAVSNQFLTSISTSGVPVSAQPSCSNVSDAANSCSTTAATANTASTIVLRNGSGNFSAGTITATLTGNVTGALTGNADTATALASNPTDCSAGLFANAIAANGNLTCAAAANGQQFINVVFAGNAGGTLACTSSPCTVVHASSGVTGVTRTGSGQYVIAVSGIFSGTPSCNVTGDPNFSGNIGVYNYQGSSATSINVFLLSVVGSGTDGLGSVNCTY